MKRMCIHTKTQGTAITNSDAYLVFKVSDITCMCSFNTSYIHKVRIWRKTESVQMINPVSMSEKSEDIWRKESDSYIFSVISKQALRLL